MPNETEVDPALLEAHVWILTVVMVSQYAERRTSSFAERANLLAKHANDLGARHARMSKGIQFDIRRAICLA
jgi:hypothetical protein